MTPEGWRNVGLFDVVEIASGQVDPRQLPYCAWPLVAPNHIEEGTGRLHNAPTAEAQGAISGKYTFLPGDVLYSKIRPYLRKAALPGFAGLCSADVYPLRPKTNVNPGFLVALLLGKQFTDFAISVSMRTGIPKINREELARFAFVLPPFPEQKRIAAILFSVDVAIEATLAVIDQLKIVKKAMMAELLTRGLPGRHTRFKMTELGEVPGEWDVEPLGALLSAIDAGWSPLCESRPAGANEWGVLRVSAVSWGEYQSEENKRLPDALPPRPELEVCAGDLLVSRANTPELVGRCVLVRVTRPRLMLSDKLLRLRADEARVIPAFLRLALDAPSARQQIQDGATGSSRSMKNISQEKLRDVKLPTPPVPEQRVIAQLIDLPAHRITIESEHLDCLREVKAALMSVLLSGEVRVKADEVTV